MHPRRTFFLLSSCLTFIACGSAPPVESPPPPPPVELTAAGPPAPPLEVAGVGEGPVEETDNGSAGVMSGDACIEKLREGRPAAADGPDGALYAEALRAERAGDPNSARKGYLQVIMKYPQSSFIPLSYFAFGELFVRESLKDPSKYTLAEQSFMEVVKYPPAENMAWSAAHFRLAEVYRAKGDGLRALSELKKVLDQHTMKPNATCSASLVEAARGEIVVAYADVGRPGVAYGFFQHASGDRPGENVHALSMVAALADHYAQNNKPREATEALLAANAESYGESFCKKERLVIEKLGGAGSKVDELRQVHAKRCAAL